MIPLYDLPFIEELVYLASDRLGIFLFFNRFIYFWLCWVFVAAHGLPLVAANRGYSSLRCTGFSLQWLLSLWSMGSRRVDFGSCGSQALERRLSSCSTWA